jgi:hypothetical protein
MRHIKSGEQTRRELGQGGAPQHHRHICPPLDFSRIHLQHISPDCLSGFVSARI